MAMNIYSEALTIKADALFECPKNLAIFESKANRIVAHPL